MLIKKIEYVNNRRKKYSSAEWDKSYTNGYRKMMKAPNYRFKLHNTGKKDGINMFYDYSAVRLNTLGIFDKKIIGFTLKMKKSVHKLV
jgi:hypothetical protein